MFESPESQNVKISYSVQGGSLEKTESKLAIVTIIGIVSDGRQTLPCFKFELQNKKETLLIVPEHENSVEELRKAFHHCSRVIYLNIIVTYHKKTPFNFGYEEFAIHCFKRSLGGYWTSPRST